jgi:putative transposase
MIVRKAFKYRIDPNKKQQAALAVRFGHRRYSYNGGLAKSQDRFPGSPRLAKQLPILKACKDTAWLKEAHFQVLQQALMNLDAAFQQFFDEKGGYPHFKSKRARQSIRDPQPIPNWISPNERRIDLPKVGHVRVVMHRPLAGQMKHVTVSRTKREKSFVSIQVEDEPGSQLALAIGRSQISIQTHQEKSFYSPLQ